jgi:hypothetical protein
MCSKLLIPFSASHSKSAKSSLFWSTRQHVGSVIFASMCSAPAGLISEPLPGPNSTSFNSYRKILVTACSSGQVVAWNVLENLDLNLMAQFHSRHSATSTASSTSVLHSVAVFPKMVYRQLSLSKPPDFSQAFSADSNLVEVANLYYELYCVLGFADGLLEVWSMSSDARYCTNDCIFSVRESSAAIACITPSRTNNIHSDYANSGSHVYVPNSIYNEFTLANHPPGTAGADPFPSSAAEDIVCAYEDGTVVVYELRINPFYSLEDEVNNILAGMPSARIYMRRLNYLRLPYKVQQLLPSTCHYVDVQTLKLKRTNSTANTCTICVWDYLCIGEFEVAEFLPFVPHGKVLPRKWRNITKKRRLSIQDGATTNDTTTTAVAEVKDDDFDPGFFSDEVLNMNNDVLDQQSLGTESTSTTDLHSLSAFSRSSSSTASRSDKKNYIGQMESMQRIVCSDQYIAKKDRRLLELFTQNVDGPDSTMSAEKVLVVVQRWCNEVQGLAPTSSATRTIARPDTVHEIKEENLRELFKLLDIQKEDRLRLVEVAKIASITISAVKKGAQLLQKDGKDSTATNRKTYKTLRNTITKVFTHYPTHFNACTNPAI